MAIAPLSLGQVHGVVCGSQQSVRVRAILGKEADADAGTDTHSLLVQGEGLGKGALDVPADRVGLPDFVNGFEDDHELVATDAVRAAAPVDDVREPAPEAREQRIARGMAEGVVERLGLFDTCPRAATAHRTAPA